MDATIPCYRSGNREHTKIYFNNFGAIIQKIWIFEHLNHFLEIIFLKNKSNPPRDQLGAPGAVHPLSLTSGPACQPCPLART